MTQNDSQPSTGRQFLFIGGTSRSGTSAMANLLRTHPAIAMGRERYGWRFRDGDAFSPALFEKERFCLDYRADDSHHAVHHEYYRELYPRFDQCVYVGDKIPSLPRRYSYVLDTFPGCRIIYMARNVFDVAASFQVRADETARQLKENPDADAARLWPLERDWKAAVTEWNLAVEDTLRLGDSPRLFVADYELLFAGDVLLERLLAFLGVAPAPSLLQQWELGKKRRARLDANRKPNLTELQLRQIRQEARLDRFEELLKRSRRAPGTP